MNETTKCPDSISLRALLDGGLADHEQSAIQSHLESCEACQQRLESLAAGKDSWLGVAQFAQAAVHETALDNVMNEAKKLSPVETSFGASESTAPVALDFLQPSDEPGVLGRLGHYDVISTIGRGGMGIVLKAFDLSLRRIVAIKVMSAHLAANPAARRRFVREAHSAAAVSHDHVVAIHAVEDSHEPPYLVMQFIEGKTLQDRLERTGPLDLREILRIGIQTASGLAAAHAQGLVHRDIKPANILLENGVERVKLTDFGLARAVDDASMTYSGIIAGTPQFMSPEQARGDLVDHRSDLFSLGSLLYAMCVGHAPFRATTTMGVLKRVCEDTPRPIRETNPDIPEWLVHIISKLHAKNPHDRFQSAKEIAELLSQHLAHVQHPLSSPCPPAISPVATNLTSGESPFRSYDAVMPEMKPIVGVWRDGSKLVMHRRARLPDRCVKTNQTTTNRLRRHLVWHHPVLYLIFLLNPLIFILIARLMGKTADIQVGLSRRWVIRRRWTIGVGWFGFLAGAGLAVYALTQTLEVMFLAGIVIAVVSGACSAKFAEIVSVKRIDGEYIFLRGFCRDYLTMLPEWSNGE